MRLVFYLIACLFIQGASAQPSKYTPQQAHSHNDYEQQQPFSHAYARGFGSIEADIYLVNNSSLFVAHTTAELEVKKRTLDSLYLQPLAATIRANKGAVYADSAKRLQLLIDLKTAAEPTLDKLVQSLRAYPELTSASSLRVTISGNRPDPLRFTDYPPFIYFDGEMGRSYPVEALARISLMSAPLGNYTAWKGPEPLADSDRKKIAAAIDSSHRMGKPVRFWGAPDLPAAWDELRELGVDYINTDHIDALSTYLAK